MLNLDVDESEIPYLAVVLAVIRDEPGNRQELLERLIDSVLDDAKGRPRRFFSDVNTKCGVHIYDRAADLADDAHFVTYVLTTFRQFFGVDPDVEAVRHRVFTYGTIPGCVIELWEPGTRPTTAILKCAKCGAVYDFGANAQVVTDEDVHETVRRLGGQVSTLPDSGDARSRHPDLVMGGGGTSGHDQLSGILADLRSGGRRRWMCKECDHVQGYPGSFFRHRFT